MAIQAFDLFLPETPHPGVVFSSPHSGRDYPDAFLAATSLDAHAIRSSEDAFVDLLFADAPRYGAPLIAARAPRAFVDLNRAEDEFDPALIESVPRLGLNPRVTAGLGVIPRVVANGRAIYSGRIPLSEAKARIDTVWRPYHRHLAQLLNQSRTANGDIWLLDCHSMPHEAIVAYSRGGRRRPDVVLGDRFGAAAGAEVVARIEAAFASEGLQVARNAPFAGAYIAQAYGRPSRGQHVVQIEIDRALYMDERAIRPRPDFDQFRALIGRVIGRILGSGRERAALAAE